MMNIRAKAPPAAKWVLLAALGALLPAVCLFDSYIVLLLCTTGISIIVISGLDILFGYSGQISLGHAGFYCIGAYTSAILSRDLGLPVFATIFIGGLFAMALAILLALPAVKLVHHFLALVTISFGELVYLFVSQARGLTEGYSGMNFIPRPKVGSFSFESNTSYFYVVYAFLVVLLFLKQRLVRSRTGRAFIAIREDTHAANGMGVNVTKYKTMAFAVSAFYTGVAGALYAHLIGFISPESFSSSQSTLFLTMLLFGGMGNFWGPIIGAGALAIVSEFLQKLGSYQMLVYGVFLLAIIVYIPGGVSQGINVLSLARGRDKKEKAAMLSLRDATIRFGGLTAVDHLTMQVEENSITALIGPNGAGKTTAFNLISGVYEPVEGGIEFAGKDISGLKPYQINEIGIARTYQNIRLFNGMSVLDNILVGRHTRGTCGIARNLLRTPRQRSEEKEMLDKANAILEFIQLADYASEDAKNLPYGQQKKLEIARALASDPKMLLLDEPVAGMNSKEKADVMDLILKIRGLGKTILLVEHDMKIVMGMADSIYVMNYGKRIAEGKPEEIQRNPIVIEAYLGGE